MSAIGYHHALATIGRQSPRTSHDVQKHAVASLHMFTTASYYRRRVVSHAAVNIPPDALVNPSRKPEDAQNQWGIDVKEGEKVTLWFLITGNVDDIKADIPPGSNVLTIKRKANESTKADELDVRLLLTEHYDTKEEPKVHKEGLPDQDKVRVEVTIGIKNTT
ncbi:hypothetical protein EJB05_19046 [Eragrostis curvula]|uniref:Uncharacterized protein n=1 Tax=Eragrostis curvula TaxID=38414 RepID=A0A5J9UWP2_9POAL|nr:hypothetical protein EJB05_19046 [Eragrostis curvula]